MNEVDEPLLTPRERNFLAQNPSAKLIDAETDPIEKRELKGVGGWLLLLAVALLIFGPLLNFALVMDELSIAQSGQRTASEADSGTFMVWGFYVFYVSLSIFAGYRLFKCHVRSTVLIVILCMWAPVVLHLALVLASDSGSSEGVAVGRSVISVSAWTAYLLVSRRVKNTYLGDAPAYPTYRWQALGRSKRQYAFFAVCWIVLAILYFHLIAPLDSYPKDAEARRMWAIILLPPILLPAGWWAYGRFVGTGDDGV